MHLLPAPGEPAPARRATIGWRVAPTARGRGYAPEAAACLIEHGFARLGLREIVAPVPRGDAAARRVAEKIGMRPAPPGPDAASGLLVFRARIDCAR